MDTNVSNHWDNNMPALWSKWLRSYNFTSTLDSLTLTDKTIGTEQHNTDLAGLEVHAHALDARGEPRRRLATMLHAVWS